VEWIYHNPDIAISNNPKQPVNCIPVNMANMEPGERNTCYSKLVALVEQYPGNRRSLGNLFDQPMCS
jgi:hypothetical protein